MDAATPDFTPLPHPAAPPIYPAPPAADSDYATSDVMIPMRDGVRLHTVIVTPKNATAPLPILMERTPYGTRSEEHTSELQSQSNLVCRLLLEKKKNRPSQAERRGARRSTGPSSAGRPASTSPPCAPRGASRPSRGSAPTPGS